MRQQPTFDWLEHTADIRVRIRGSDEADLYASTALALTAMLIEWPEDKGAAANVSVEVEGETPEERVVELLRELLFRFDVAGDLWIEASATVDGPHVRLTGRAVEFDAERHQGIREVKAVTYHQLESGVDEQGYYADVVLDV